MTALAYHPADPWPNYTGLRFNYPDEALVIAIDGLFFEVEVAVECRGMSDGLFEPLNFTIEDAYGNTRSWHYGAPDAGPLQVAVSKAIDREWDTILAWCVEKADEERE